MWYQTKVTELLGIEYPIMQGPFGGGLSSVELISRVSNLGGLGGLGAVGFSPEEIYQWDKNIKAATNKPYNLNLWVSDSDAVNSTVTQIAYAKTKQLYQPYFDEAGIEFPKDIPSFQSRFENQLQVVLDIKPKVFSFMFGLLPNDLMDECRRRGIKLVGVATTLDEGIALDNLGVDIVVASGFEAGGHRPSFLDTAEQSTTGTFVLTQLLREKLKAPIVSAGGIADGRAIAAAFTLGASGVQVGTAFLACDESGALPAHKAALFSKAAWHTMLSRAYTGRLGRGITTRLAKDLTGKESDILPYPLQSRLMGTLRQAALDQQKHDMVLFWSGQIAPILKHKKVEDLMRSLIEETPLYLRQS